MISATTKHHTYRPTDLNIQLINTRIGRYIQCKRQLNHDELHLSQCQALRGIFSLNGIYNGMYLQNK